MDIFATNIEILNEKKKRKRKHNCIYYPRTNSPTIMESQELDFIPVPEAKEVAMLNQEGKQPLIAGKEEPQK